MFLRVKEFATKKRFTLGAVYCVRWQTRSWKLSEFEGRWSYDWLLGWRILDYKKGVSKWMYLGGINVVWTFFYGIKLQNLKKMDSWNFKYSLALVFIQTGILYSRIITKRVFKMVDVKGPFLAVHNFKILISLKIWWLNYFKILFYGFQNAHHPKNLLQNHKTDI